MAPWKLLLVDDEPHVLSSLKRLFIEDDVEILTAENGAKGLAAIKQSGPVSVILSDYRMPLMDGLEFLRKAREVCPTAVPIILSGHHDTHIFTTAILEGKLQTFLAKPWKDDFVRSVVLSLGRTPVQPHMSPSEFEIYKDFVRKNTGIQLVQDKKALISQRLLRRMREVGLSSFTDYFHRVSKASGRELEAFFDCVCVNDTSFFREYVQIHHLEKNVFPRWKEDGDKGRRPKSLTVWSAGCSTGEEPYTLAMIFLSIFPPKEGWEVKIHATDISTKALEQAQAGQWPLGKSGDIPPSYTKRFMASSENVLKAGAEVRRPLKFSRVNLHDPHYSVPGPFDLIFCRNVLTYFDKTDRDSTARRLLSLLAPQGFLCVGEGETLDALAGFRRDGPMTYSSAAPPPSGSLPAYGNYSRP